MPKSLFATILFLFFLLPAFAESGLNASLAASALETGEAQAVDFFLKITDFPESVLEFEWSFGDGAGIVTMQPFASHAYYLDFPHIDSQTKDFQAKARIKHKNSGKVLTEKTAGIRVSRSEFKAFLPPSSEAKQGIVLETGTEKKIIFAFLDKDNSFIQRFFGAGEQESILSFSASIKGKSIALQWDSQNLFLEGAFFPDNSFNEVEKIELKATTPGSAEKTFSIPLFFKQPEISVASPFGDGKQYVVDSKIGVLSFSLILPDGARAVDSGDFEAWLLSGTEVVERQRLSFKNSNWSAEFNHRIAEADRGRLEITVSGQDDFGRMAEKNSFALETAVHVLDGEAPAGDILFVFPNEGTIESRGGANRLELHIGDQNVFGKNISALIYIDGNQYSIVLSCNEKGLCSASLPFALTGKHDLNIVLKQPFFGKTGISTNIVEPTDWDRVFVLGCAVFALVLAASALFWRKKHRAAEKRSVERRLEGISGLEKKAKIDFFKRRLSEGAYRERLLKLQQEKDLLLKKPKPGKKEKK